jgi:polyphosphate glucokinase
LVVDVGGSHVKFRIGTRGVAGSFDSGPTMTASQMVQQVTDAVPSDAYDAVSIGYPGPVIHRRITAEPHNLGPGWVGYDFERQFGKPVRLINDAAMQAIGSYAGGRMLFLGLGTGLGAALIIDGVVEGMEIGHMCYKKHRTFEDYLGEQGRKRLGNKKWRKQVLKAVTQLSTVLEADYVVLGGGNAKRLKRLPPNSRLGNNHNAFVGGLRLWQHGDDPPVVMPATTRRDRH